MKIINYISIALALFLVSCGGSNMEKLKWLEGTWTSKINEENAQVEKWSWAEKVINGKAIFVSDGDETVMEKLTIMEKNGELIYTADIPENDMMVDFKMTSIDNHKVVFEKPNYDWPQTIIYEMVGDSLITTAVGESKGQTKSVSFTYYKN